MGLKQEDITKPKTRLKVFQFQKRFTKKGNLGLHGYAFLWAHILILSTIPIIPPPVLLNLVNLDSLTIKS